MTSLLDSLITERSTHIPRLLIYGREKIGKTTLASEFPDHIIIDIEGGASFLDCVRTPKITKTRDVWDILCDLETTDTPYKTVVIDSIDWLADLIGTEICKDHPEATGIADKTYKPFSYGQGYKMVADKLNIILSKLDTLYHSKNITPILIGHSKVRTITSPMHDDYDKLELKMPGSVSALVKEWVDQIILLNSEFYIDSDKKAHNAKRVAYCEANPSYEGGGRLGMKNFEYVTGKGFEAIKKQLTID